MTAETTHEPLSTAPRATTVPRATARLQFHAGFTLDDAVQVVPYLARLGVSHLYASPILQAAAGSTHGYDITGHDAINPELGGEPALHRLVAALRAQGLGLLLDIVPNHMGVAGNGNAAWNDVLARGRDSEYAKFFDIDWDVADPALRGKLLAPFLGRAYGEALAEGELTLVAEGPTGLSLAYFDNRFPIAPRDAETILDDAEGLAPFDPRSVTGAARLHELLERQNYRLAWWRTASDEINWRRFFDVTGLAGLRAEDPEVFDRSHALVLRLYAEGLIDGVRIDHVDGLADPGGYCRKLRRRMESAGRQRPPEAPAGPPYILVEKILAAGEPLATSWRVDGTTGYDFMDQVGALLHDPAGEAPLSALWREVSGSAADFAEEERAARRQILRDNLAAELDGCARALHRVARGHLRTRDISFNALRRVLVELLVHFPVYRIYARLGAADAQDMRVMAQAAQGAMASLPPTDHAVLAQLFRWLAEEAPHGPQRADLLKARTRFEQLSSPTAAKSVEDTAFYRYARLLSRNEVGSDPGHFSLSPEGFHAIAAARGAQFPGAMLATATHDHKRGEDVRARLAVLSEMPDDWASALRGWLSQSASLRQALPEGTAPDDTDAVMLFQMIVGSWPLGLSATDREGIEAWIERLLGWQQKAMREAKRRSGWAMPDEAYENAAAGFLRAVLDGRNPALLRELQAFATRIAPAGALKGLAQAVLRLTLPGVPDLYQGTEFWDQSLVDPDNRRPVDFAERLRALEQPADPAGLLGRWQDGQVKQFAIARLLQLRSRYPSLFRHGSYEPLAASGPGAGSVVAFLRRSGPTALVVAVPHRALPLLGKQAEGPAITAAAWGDTALRLPEDLTARGWRCVMSDRSLPAGTALANIAAPLPFAVLVGEAG
jgi:(1->4)-alpha-D-glucan 1-alpha-D-glucosylmutase